MNNHTFSFWNAENNQVCQEYFQKIMSALAGHQIVFWEYNLETGEIVLSKDAFKILGLERLGIHFSSIEDTYSSFYPDDLKFYKEAFYEMLESQTKRAVIRYRRVGAKGEIVWFEDHYLFAQKDEKDGYEKLIAYTVNVTSDKEKDSEIDRLAAYSRKIIEVLHEIIFIFDDDFYIRDVLVGKDTILFHSISTLIGSNGRDYYTPEVCELFLKNIRTCLTDHNVHEIEFPFEVDGMVYYFQARIAPFEEHKVLALIHDITNRVQRSKELIEAKKRAEESDKMKTLFLANMSHEIRTPLNAIIGFSEIVSLAEDDEQRNEYLSIIRRNNDLLLQLINDILDLSRIESGKSEMYIQSVNLSELIKEASAVHRLKMPSEIKFETIYPEKEISILTDRNRLMQVLSNLISNAIKNTEKGSITLGGSIEAEWARLYVLDTGRGIAEDKKELIFNRFEKLDSFAQGAGLGLSICKSIIERLGGRMEVESTLGKGSCFSVYLYLHAQNDDVLESVEKKKVLIAETSEMAYKELESVLQDQYELLWRMDGEKALSAFLSERPDLVLVNMNIKNLSGAQVIEKLRRMSASVPIVAVTEHIYYTEQQRALQAGCNEVVTKPYSLNRIQEILAYYLH